MHLIRFRFVSTVAGFQDEHAKAYVSLVALDEEPYQDDSQLIGSLAPSLGVKPVGCKVEEVRNFKNCIQ